MMKLNSRKIPLNHLSCLFYILKPEDATIRSLFYALVFKVVQYLSNLSIFVTFVQYLSNTKYTVIRKINHKYFLFSGFPKFAKRLAKTFCFGFMTCSNLFRKITFLYSIMTFTRKYTVKYCKSWKEGSNVGKFRNRLYHSHKKRKDSLETRAVFTWILIWTWNFGGSRSGSTSTLASASWFWCY